jgi:type I restriction enzyme S subunit
MMWEEVKFSDLFSIPLRNGIWKGKDFHGRGVKIINMGELFKFDFISNQDMKRIELNEPEKEKFTVNEYDLLFARRSVVADGAGKVSIVVTDTEPKTYESSIIRVRLNRDFSYPFFYYYYFTSRIGRASILSLATGANVKGIKGSELKNLSVPLPPLPIQKKIASILSAYDDLIENNLRRIKLLEEAAQNLYRDWFVHLRFPGHENVKIVNGLPEGWEEELIGNTLLKVKRKPKIKRDEYNQSGKIPIIDQGSGYINGFTNDSSYLQEEPLPIIIFGDHTRRIKYVDFPFASGADGTQLIYPNLKRLLPSYFFYAIKNIDLSNYAYARHFKFLKEQKLIIPKFKTLDYFNELTAPFLKQITKLIFKNQKLKEARDLLLPRLMDRRIEVDELM